MIRSIQKILRNFFATQALNDVDCPTLMAEVEAIINSRPLVPVSFTDTSQELLAPNHLLLLQGNPNMPPGLFSSEDCYFRRLRAQIQFLANHAVLETLDRRVGAKFVAATNMVSGKKKF